MKVEFTRLIVVALLALLAATVDAQEPQRSSTLDSNVDQTKIAHLQSLMATIVELENSDRFSEALVAADEAEKCARQLYKPDTAPVLRIVLARGRIQFKHDLSLNDPETMDRLSELDNGIKSAVRARRWRDFVAMSVEYQGIAKPRLAKDSPWYPTLNFFAAHSSSVAGNPTLSLSSAIQTVQSQKEMGLEQASTHGSAWWHIAQASLDLGDLARASEAILKAEEVFHADSSGPGHHESAPIVPLFKAEIEIQRFRLDRAQTILNGIGSVGAGSWEERYLNYLSGRLMIESGDPASAIWKLRSACVPIAVMPLMGSDHADLLEVRARYELARAYLQLGDLAEATRQLDEAEDLVFQRWFETSMPGDTLAGLRAEIEMSRGRLERAEGLLAESLRHCKEKYGDTHVAYLKQTIRLSRLRSAQGEPDEAMTLANEAKAGIAKSYGKKHPAYAEALVLISDLSPVADKPALLIEALEVRKEIFGGRHTLVQSNLRSVISALEKVGRGSESEPFKDQLMSGY
jgi:tetratricopeptide (TPR) repeat protein